MKSKKLHVVYILPSRYDDEGYVLRFWRGILPSNTLTVLSSLTRAAAQNHELGEDVETTVEVFDDAVQRVPLERIIRRHRRGKEKVLVGLVGVQSNQFPRAADLALQFRAAGVPVMLGGFHVSGVLALFHTPSPELQELMDQGVTLVKGEVEAPGVLAGILRDALEETLLPLYDITEAPDLSTAAIPSPEDQYLRRFLHKNMGTIDTSRGCPFNCSFCTIINVQGRKMRHRSAACMLQTMEQNYARGVNFYFFTDDNFARCPVWEELFDGLIALRERGLKISFMMQVDTIAYKIPNFIEKASRAGCYLVFIGMETINPDNIQATGKRQNKADQFAHMVQLWHHANILVHVGYIIGLPHDTRESVRWELDVLRNDIKVDMASFFMLTPLPGSRDHFNMVKDRKPLDADLNNYDSFHETFRHAHLAPGEWKAAYDEAWDTLFSKENITNVLLRTPRQRYWPMLWLLIWYRFCTLARTHPMVTGLFRLKDRKARRAIFEREGVLPYAWRRLKDAAWGVKTYARLFVEFQEIWMLTRKEDDPRWATLADLRTRWTEVRQRLREVELQNRCDVAVSEIKEMLHAASERLQQLSGAPARLSRRARQRLQNMAQEADSYLRSLDVSMPTWRHVITAESFISEKLLTGYEELAIRYVANRRQLNAYRQELIERLKTGRIWTLNVSTMPRLACFELFLGLRFGVTCLSQLF
ncbi:MAG: radical SAM protein [Candidatus Hydrogenedentes bacterium]|nr:radical SAM protein [Candidatus Hydrogenedentota bacterium]